MNRYLEVLNESFDKVVIALNDKEGREQKCMLWIL